MAVQPPRRIPQDRPADRYDRTYWLNRCHGFEVEVEGTLIGRVSELRYASRADLPDSIVVRTGHLRHGLLVISIARIERIDGNTGRLELTANAYGRDRAAGPYEQRRAGWSTSQTAQAASVTAQLRRTE